MRRCRRWVLHTASYGGTGTAPGVVQGADKLVHGQVTLRRQDDGTIQILRDRFDFEMHDVDKYERRIDGWKRNAETAAGRQYARGLRFWRDGTDFYIQFEGEPNVVQ